MNTVQEMIKELDQLQNRWINACYTQETKNICDMVCSDCMVNSAITEYHLKIESLYHGLDHGYYKDHSLFNERMYR